MNVSDLQTYAVYTIFKSLLLDEFPGSQQRENHVWDLNVCLAFPFPPSLTTWHFRLPFGRYGYATLYAIFEPRLYLDIPFYFSACSRAPER